MNGVLRGWGVRIQIGRTFWELGFWPFYREWHQSLMAPNLYGFGLWITRDRRL